MTVEEWKQKNPPIQRKPVTHYDLVHAMTAEELAEWLCDIAGWLPMYEGKMHPILDWLKQEAT